MFTSCKLDTLRSTLFNVIELCYKNACSQYILVEGTKVSYSNKIDGKTYKKEEIMELIDIVLENNYVSFLGLTTHQIKGVPMGLPSAPKMIDLCMSFYEYKYLTNPLNRTIAQNISHYCCRYVDDFASLANENINEFIRDIYPPELSLLQTSLPLKMAFLDVHITVEDNIIHTRVYNKTDDFPFNVMRYSHFDSNVHESVGYNTFYGEMVRYCRICSDRNPFELRVKSLVHDFLNHGYSLEKLIRSVSKFVMKYDIDLVKLNILDDIDRAMFTQRIFS